MPSRHDHNDALTARLRADAAQRLADTDPALTARIRDSLLHATAAPAHRQRRLARLVLPVAAAAALALGIVLIRPLSHPATPPPPSAAEAVNGALAMLPSSVGGAQPTSPPVQAQPATARRRAPVLSFARMLGIASATGGALIRV